MTFQPSALLALPHLVVHLVVQVVPKLHLPRPKTCVDVDELVGDVDLHVEVLLLGHVGRSRCRGTSRSFELKPELQVVLMQEGWHVQVTGSLAARRGAPRSLPSPAHPNVVPHQTLLHRLPCPLSP